MNLTSKVVYYVNDSEGYSYQMRPSIYDSKFKIDEETSKAMTWISFPNLLPTSIASAVGRPLHLDLATINKTRPSCARVKVWWTC